VFFHELKDATGIAEARILLGNFIFIQLEGPLGLVILAGFRVITGKKTFLEPECITNEERCISIVDQILFEVFFILDDVVDHTAEKSDIGTRAERDMKIGTR